MHTLSHIPSNLIVTTLLWFNEKAGIKIFQFTFKGESYEKHATILVNTLLSLSTFLCIFILFFKVMQPQHEELYVLNDKLL